MADFPQKTDGNPPETQAGDGGVPGREAGGEGLQDPFQLHRQALAALSENRAGIAASLLRKAVEAAPENSEMLQDLGVALEAIGEYDDAVENFQKAIALKPDFAQAFNNLGNALLGLRKEAEALDAYRSAEALAPESPLVQVNIANSLENLGEYPEAAERYRRAIQLQPDLKFAHFPLARTLLALGEPASALETVEQCLARDPHVQEAIALKVFLLREVGRHDEARELLDFDRFIGVFRPPTPTGYANMEEFHQDLIAHVSSHPTLTYELYGSSTHNGRHSRNILLDKEKPAVAFRAMLQDVFGEYLSGFLNTPPNPLIRDPVPQCRISAQAQLLNSAGYLESHIHPQTWVSGAYYLQLPDVIADGEGHPGWIEFGLPSEYIKTTVDPETRLLQPEEGMVVLFPSYFFHGTRPFESDDLRISFGCDLIPVAESP